jgi:hypothetical protein
VAKRNPALEAAQKAAAARAKEEAAKTPPPVEVDLDEAECFVQLVIESYSSGMRMGMGTMPDGMAIWMRLSVPSTATSPYAGMVAFLVSDDTLTVLRKAVASLEAPAKPPYWKPDQFARTNAPPT